MMKISSSQAAPIPRAAMPRTMAEFVTVRSSIICNGDNDDDDHNDADNDVDQDQDQDQENHC